MKSFQIPITYVSGFWLLPDSPKYASEHYWHLIPKTLRMLSGQRLVFFYDNESIGDFIRDQASENAIDLLAIYWDLKELPGHEYSESLLQCCRAMGLDSFPEPKTKAGEKGSIHYWRDYKRGGDDFYKSVIAIWISKLDLIRHAIVNTEPESERYGYNYAWIDASISRFNRVRKNWDFRKCALPEGVLNHYGNNMRYYSQVLPVNASFLHADVKTWETIYRLFWEKIEQSLTTSYGHDEETLLSLCAEERPELFNQIGSAPKSDRITHYMAKIRQRIAPI